MKQNTYVTLNIAVWNVRCFGNKESELVEEIKIKGIYIYIAVISETKKKLIGTKVTGTYSMPYSGVSQETRAQSGAALIIDHKWTSRITNYSFVNDRIITISKEWTTPDSRNKPSTTNLEVEEIMDALGNDGDASMPEQVNRPNPWRKSMMMMMKYMNIGCALQIL